VLGQEATGQGWTWRDREGHVRTLAELHKIVRAHKEWLKDHGEGSPYTGGTDDRAELGGSDLQRVDLSAQHLGYANFSSANLSHGHFNVTDFRGVLFPKANLSDADLREANLNGAFLNGALLHRADLAGANLTKAVLVGADLTGAYYEPQQSPSPSDIAYAVGLGQLQYDGDPAPLVKLRSSLKDAGFDKAARQVTAALHRHKQSRGERILFDWTCEWGANWLRPLKLMGVLSLVFAIIYWLGMHFGKRSGLYLAATGQRVTTSNGKERSLRIGFRLPRSTKWYRYILRVSVSEFRTLGTAILFSLMSIFNIGFREFNFGRWIRMLQPREFDIRARGWMRTLSGLQSLLGVALVALSLLSYFGHPFD
jgi:uncharacterized protein YjbI with pentapeptide repeats